MDVNKIETEAERITIKLIEICSKNNSKSILDLFNELIDKKMKDRDIEILSLIPNILARKGYDIINTNPLELKEY